jgi:hypothetical protein
VTLLNEAANVYAGGAQALRIYRGAQEIWTPGGGEPTTDYWFSFEGGTDGDYISLTPPTGVPFDEAPAFAYSAGEAKNGAMGGTGFGGGDGRGQWNLPAAASQHSVGFWHRAGGTSSSAEARIMDFRATASSGTVCGLLLTVAGNVRMMQGSSGLSVGQSPAVDRAKWYWLGYTVDLATGDSVLTIHDENGAPWHSGSYTITPPYSSCLTARFGRIFGTSSGGFGMDDIQWQPGSTVALPPWGI